MGALFSSPAMPPVPPPPPPPPSPPTVANASVGAAGAAARARAAAAEGAGFGDTIATSPQGALAAPTAAKTLLGQAILIGAILLSASAWAAEPHGAVATTSVAEVCAYVDGQSYSKRHRLVHRHGRAGYELDHIIPICSGGADTEDNLQWQPLAEAHEKDRVEAYACREVCAGRLPLETAQGWFLSGDWRAHLSEAHR